MDFACSAPYVKIDMHPGAGVAGARGAAGARAAGLGGSADTAGAADLDAIYFSCHKFLGGPGTPGVLVFNRRLYRNRVPDRPGGGTLLYSNPWKVHEYVADIEQREDGGTPPILQGIKAAMCIRLKEEMGVEWILKREEELVLHLLDRLSGIGGVEILEADNRRRLGVISFIVKDAHYNLIVKILNDRFGIQSRGGCSCAGTYGHMLLGIDEARSYEILKLLRAGELLSKPGWVRLSIHPTMTDAEIDYIMDAVEMTVARYAEWQKDYVYDPRCNGYVFREGGMGRECIGVDWFSSPLL